MQGHRQMRPAGFAAIETDEEMPGKQLIEPEHGRHCDGTWPRQGVRASRSDVYDGLQHA